MEWQVHRSDFIESGRLRPCWRISVGTAIAEAAPYLETGFGIDFNKFLNKENKKADYQNNPLLAKQVFEAFNQYIKNIIHELNKLNFSKNILEKLYNQGLRQSLLEYGINLESDPSIIFALECCILQLLNKTPTAFNSSFFQKKSGIFVNGLISRTNDKLERISQSIENYGYQTLKMKIGSHGRIHDIDIANKIYLSDQKDLQDFVSSFPDIKIRLDANSSFPTEIKLAQELLLNFRKTTNNIDYIEQPYSASNLVLLQELSASNIIPIALDESLVLDTASKDDHLYSKSEKKGLLTQINPSFLIIKPTNIGGIKETLEWIELAKSLGKIKIVFTSCMESSFGHLQCLDFISSLIDNENYKDIIDLTHGFSTWNNCSCYPDIQDNQMTKFSITSGKIKY